MDKGGFIGNFSVLEWQSDVGSVYYTSGLPFRPVSSYIEKYTMLNVCDIRSSTIGGFYRLSATLKSDSPSGLDAVQNEIFFELPEQYAEFVQPDRADCFLLGLLYFAMFRNEPLHIEGAVSGQLLATLRSDVIALLAVYRKTLHRIEVTATETRHFPGGSLVGTGFSAGVDSFYTIFDNLRNAASPEEKIGVLFCFNVGTHGLARTLEERAATEDKFRRRFHSFQGAAAELGLPFIPINTNLPSFLPENILAEISLENAAAAYFVAGALSRYLIASAGYNYAELFELYRLRKKRPLVSMEVLEPLLLGLLSLPGLQFSPSGTEARRIDKCRLLANEPVAGRNLNVCNSTAVIDRNCSVCVKCRRTMTDLEILGRLDHFREAFDVDRYRRNFKSRDYAKILHPSKYDHFSCQTLEYVREHGIDLAAEVRPMDRLCAFLATTCLYDALKRCNILESVKRLFGRVKS